MNNKILNIRLKRSNSKVMSVWEIQDFMNKLITNYYKIDIINEVSKEINNGVSLDRIVIMDKSFDFKVNYSYLGDSDTINLQTEDGAKKFFHLGTPTGIFPSTDILELKIKLKLIKMINNYLYNKRVSRLPKNNINKIIFSDFKEATELIEYNTKAIILKNFKEKDVRQVYFKEIDNSILKTIDTIDKYNKNKYDIEKLKEDILKNDIDVITDEYKEFYNLYFDEFCKQITKLDRPVVGILSEDKKTFKILCKSYIHKKSRDERFLDLKNFSHNSPIIVELCAGLMLAIPLIPLIRSAKDSFENKVVEGELNYRENKILEKMSDMEGKLIDLANENELNNVENIEIKVVNNSMKNVNKEFIKRMNDNLNTYNFDNHNIKINIIDFNKEKEKRTRKKIKIR